MIEMIDEVLPSWRWVFSLASRSGGGVACGVVPDTRWVVARLVFSAPGFFGVCKWRGLCQAWEWHGLGLATSVTGHGGLGSFCSSRLGIFI